MNGPDRRLVARLEVRGGVVRLELAAGSVHRLDVGTEVASDVVGALADAQEARDHRVSLDGRALERHGRARRVRAGLLVMDTPEVAADVSVRDHLAAVAGSAVTGARSADGLLAQIPQLARRRDEPAGVLSGGERRLLAWLGAIALRPRVVVLAGAGTGLDAASLAWAHTVIDGWAEGGTVVIVHPRRTEEAAWVTATADGTPR